MSPFVPLSARDQPDPPPLVTGLVPYLAEPVWEWVSGELSRVPNMARDVCLALRVAAAPASGQTVGSHYLALQQIVLGKVSAHVDGLDVVDAVLQLPDRLTQRVAGSGSYRYPGLDAAVELKKILELGGSAWRVTSDQETQVLSLEKRVDDELVQAHEAAMEAVKTFGKPRSAERLAAAWADAYGRQPDPAKAVNNSIKAVEAIASIVVSPDNRDATLGTITAQLRNSASKWRTVIVDRHGNDSPDVVVTMCDHLWRADTERHEGTTPTLAVSQAAAEAAVHLAGTLVQWFSTGVVVRR